VLAVNGILCRSHAQARTLCDAAASLELMLQVSGEGGEKGEGGGWPRVMYGCLCRSHAQARTQRPA
jgi:hypothetical protein